MQSKTLENISKFDIDGGEFVDTLSIGLFKVRITPFANTDLELTQFLAEGYSGSLNSFRKVQNENGGNRKSYFLEDLDDNSPNIKILVNPNISKTGGDWTSTEGDAPTKFVRVTNPDWTGNAEVMATAIGTGYGDDTGKVGFTELPALVSLGGYSDVVNDGAKDIGSVPSKLDRII